MRTGRAKTWNVKLPWIEPGTPAFLGDGADAFGSVREVRMRAGAPELLVNVEGGGDFVLGLDAIDKIVDQRVVLRWDALDASMQEAIRRVTDQEDFPPPGAQVEWVGGSTDDDDSLAPSYEVTLPQSPPGEFPGRDYGSR